MAVRAGTASPRATAYRHTLGEIVVLTRIRDNIEEAGSLIARLGSEAIRQTLAAIG